VIIVTGGAGFIGSNLVKGLNAMGHDDIIVVDDLTDGQKFQNLTDCEFVDYLDKEEFLQLILQRRSLRQRIDTIFHQGACSTTTEWNGQYMMQENFSYSKHLLQYCLAEKIRFIYASSASVYGMGPMFKEERQYELPLNVYGFSKCQFDQYVRKQTIDPSRQVVGLRYFNVYGPREQHKGTMASVAYHFNNQIKADNRVNLFEGTDGYAAGEQQRDFIHVSDVVNVNLWLMDHAQISGIFNVGTGRCQSFNDVANAVIHWHNNDGDINYIPFPEHLKGSYQSFTEADIGALRNAGYVQAFKTVEQGVKLYLDWLNKCIVPNH